jgi:hypothetical protein
MATEPLEITTTPTSNKPSRQQKTEQEHNNKTLKHSFDIKIFSSPPEAHQPFLHSSYLVVQKLFILFLQK